MSIILGILLTLLILTFVVFIHEMGHFLAARMTGMRVEEFGIGIPPKAKKLYKDAKGTEFTLNWLPIGGFVRIKGEDPSGDDAKDNDSFSEKKWWARSVVLIAGVTMNFILAWIILSTFFSIGTTPLSVNTLTPKSYNSLLLPSFRESLERGYITHDGISITPIEGGPASLAGISPGSILIEIEGKSINTHDEFTRLIAGSSEVTLKLKSNTGNDYSATVKPINGKIQSYLRYAGLEKNNTYLLKYGIIDSVKYGARETLALSWMTLDLLATTMKNLIAPTSEEAGKQAKEMVAGPIGMGAGMVSFVEYGLDWRLFVLIVALLSLNLGVLNILPLPALDGGRLVSTTILSFMGLFTKKKGALIASEKWIHGIGMILLITLSLYIAFLDILKL